MEAYTCVFSCVIHTDTRTSAGNALVLNEIHPTYLRALTLNIFHFKAYISGFPLLVRSETLTVFAHSYPEVVVRMALEAF
jgi:hypothetical protein